MYRHLLVPLDGSELATNLVTQAVAFAVSLGAKITFFTMRADYGASGDGALARTLSPEHFAEAEMGDANAILAKALAAAGAFKLECEGVARTGSRPYELILEVADEKGCDLIYMASHGRRGLKALMLGSQTQKVLAHATLPVLVATVEANVPAAASEAAIGIIKDEHRAIAAVTNGLRHIAQQARSGAAVDLPLLESMLHYIRAFPETLHHPKEEQYLFARLAQRTDEFAELIASLEAEHREGGVLLARLETQLAQSRAAGVEMSAQARAELGEAVEAFAKAQWQHLNAEEKLILPAAQRHLSSEDWAQIESAFRENGPLSRGSEYDEAFRRLFTRLMNLSAAEGGH